MVNGGAELEFVNFAGSTGTDQRAGGMSRADIVQLVSHALENALLAVGQDNPERFLQLRAWEARAGMRDALSSLPRAWAADPSVLADYREAIVFQNLTLELALAIMNTLERYAKSGTREQVAAAS